MPVTRSRTSRPEPARPVRAAVREHGSALMLVPAGFLILVVLAAIAVDFAVAYLGQQQLADALSAAANDASAAALSSSAFYQEGAVTLDPALADKAVCESLAAQGDRSLQDLHLQIAVSGPALRLAGTASVEAVFGRILPGFGTYKVSADVAAVASGGRPTPVPPRSALRPIAC